MLSAMKALTLKKSANLEILLNIRKNLGAKGLTVVDKLSDDLIIIIRNWDEELLVVLNKDLSNGEEGAVLRNFLNEKPEGVEAWKSISSSPISGNVFWVKQINEWICKGVVVKKTPNTIEFSTLDRTNFARIENERLIFHYSGFGGDALMNPNKQTTGLGKFREDYGDPFSNGTRMFLGDGSQIAGLPDKVIARVTSGSPSKNSLAFLDLPEVEYNTLMNNEIKDALKAKYGRSLDVSSIFSRTQSCDGKICLAAASILSCTRQA